VFCFSLLVTVVFEQDNESDLLGRMDQLSREREEVTGREEIDKLVKQLRHALPPMELCLSCFVRVLFQLKSSF
jgi:hypothetical protein